MTSPTWNHKSKNINSGSTKILTKVCKVRRHITHQRKIHSTVQTTQSLLSEGPDASIQNSSVLSASEGVSDNVLNCSPIERART